MIVKSSAILLLAAIPVVFAATSAPFSYNPKSLQGPHNWGKLPIDGNQCDGEKNSPIAVETRSCDRFEDYKFTTGTCLTRDLKYDLTDTGVKGSYPSDGSCEFPTVEIPGIGGIYQALQFHIHTSSEHTIDGEFFSAELHTVHKEVNGDRYAVVGMMIQPSSDVENETFEKLLDGWQATYDSNIVWCGDDGVGVSGGERNLEVDEVDAGRELQAEAFTPYDLIPEGATYYHYDGGLTTPPCSEVVWWNLADKPVAISPSQYSKLVTQILQYVDPNKECGVGTNAGPVGSTSRPVQPLNGRKVERICPTSFSETASGSSGSYIASMVTIGASIVAGIALSF